MLDDGLKGFGAGRDILHLVAGSIVAIMRNGTSGRPGERIKGRYPIILGQWHRGRARSHQFKTRVLIEGRGNRA